MVQFLARCSNKSLQLIFLGILTAFVVALYLKTSEPIDARAARITYILTPMFGALVLIVVLAFAIDLISGKHGRSLPRTKRISIVTDRLNDRNMAVWAVLFYMSQVALQILAGYIMASFAIGIVLF